VCHPRVGHNRTRARKPLLPWNAPFYARLGFEEVSALDAHPRLAGELANEVDDGLPVERRCAMICFLD
jgi:hypothetical protein